MNLEDRRPATLDSITLWDSREDPPRHTGVVYRWNGYSDEEPIRSLLQYVEDHADRLRAKYLTWIFEFGEHSINGKRVIDHLALEDGLSFWWMTLLAEQSLWKSPSIADAIRLLAVEEIVDGSRPSRLRLVSPRPDLHLSIEHLCRELGIEYEWAGRVRSRSDSRRPHHKLLRSLLAPWYLIRLASSRWALTRAETAGWLSSTKAVFFCSYFDNVNSEAAKAGRFHSHYWAGLHELLDRLGYESNWLQIFIPCASVPNPRSALSHVRRFNLSSERMFHTFVHSHLSWRIVLRVLVRWIKLNWVSRTLGGIREAFRPPDSHLSLWPVMRSDWLSSLRGTAAVHGLLWIELFDSALGALPHQKKGLYLCENHAWERALVHAWRKHGHGRLIAVAHATLRFWDLRYFTDPRTVRSRGTHAVPMADSLALNGRLATSNCLNVAFPHKDTVECEALRYGYLNGMRRNRTPTGPRRRPIKVLILGDDTRRGTTRMLELLEAATKLTTLGMTYTVKPHANFHVRPTDHPSLNLRVVMSPLGEIMQGFDIAYSSNLTSAAIDAYLACPQLIVMLDETTLNLSPLRGQTKVRFVDTPEGLAEALESRHAPSSPPPDPNDFFCLDSELPRWSRLLAD